MGGQQRISFRLDDGSWGKPFPRKASKSLLFQHRSGSQQSLRGQGEQRQLDTSNRSSNLSQVDLNPYQQGVDGPRLYMTSSLQPDRPARPPRYLSEQRQDTDLHSSQAAQPYQHTFVDERTKSQQVLDILARKSVRITPKHISEAKNINIRQTRKKLTDYLKENKKACSAVEMSFQPRSQLSSMGASPRNKKDVNNLLSKQSREYWVNEYEV